MSRFRLRHRFSKGPGNKPENKTEFHPYGFKKLPKRGPEISQKQYLKIWFQIPTWPSCCSHGAPKCPETAKMASKVQRVEAPGLQNNKFWIPEISISISKAIPENAMKTKLQEPTCLRTFHRKTKQIETSEYKQTQQGSSASTTQPPPRSPLP